MSSTQTRPLYILFLMLPAGISFGFATVALPYLLTKNGFSVSHTAAIVALGLSPNLFRFLGGPIADLTLSLRKWYWIGVITSSVFLLLLCITPFTYKGVLLLSFIVFISQAAANMLLIPVGGIMANRIERHKQGRAGGWYQVGNLGGIGLGGGVGLWLATHFNVQMAGLILCTLSLVSALIIQKIEDIQHDDGKKFLDALAVMGKDVIYMLKIPVVLFVTLMLCMPIGTGAANNLWAALATDWKTGADTVALVTGILGGLISALGCISGGYIADRWGNWVGYLGSGLFCAGVTLVMAIFPMVPYVYIVGVLAYSFGVGLINAAFTSVILYAIGKKNASTKYALLSSLGNLPVVYMTAFDGWAHDAFNSKYMLVTEAMVCILFVVICVLVLYKLKSRKLLLLTVD